MNITELIEKHTGDDGKLDKDAFIKELNTEMPKNFVPKSEFNTKNQALKEANETLEQLKKDNKDIEALQTKITEYETKATELEQELADERKTFTVKEALQSAGAQDVDYMIYKLGDVEVNKDGTIKDLENKVKALKEENPAFFVTTDDDRDDSKEPTPPNGFRVIDNKLDD